MQLIVISGTHDGRQPSRCVICGGPHAPLQGPQHGDSAFFLIVWLKIDDMKFDAKDKTCNARTKIQIEVNSYKIRYINS